MHLARESAGKPDALQTLARRCGWPGQTSRSVWSAGSLLPLSLGALPGDGLPFSGTGFILGSFCLRIGGNDQATLVYCLTSLTEPISTLTPGRLHGSIRKRVMTPRQRRFFATTTV